MCSTRRPRIRADCCDRQVCQRRRIAYGLYWLGQLIPALPKQALPKLDALLPTLPEKAIDQLLHYVSELKTKI